MLPSGSIDQPFLLFHSFALCASLCPALQNQRFRNHRGLPRAFHVVAKIPAVLRKYLCQRFLQKILSRRILLPHLRISSPTSTMSSNMTSCFCFFFFLPNHQNFGMGSFQQVLPILTHQSRCFSLKTTRLSAVMGRPRGFQ